MSPIIKAGCDKKWKENIMLINCNFNMNCNFKCSYCINQAFRKKFTEQLSPKALYNLFSNLPKLNKELYSIAITGGEPSLYQYFPEMLQYLNEFFPKNNFTFTCMTNGSLLHKLEEYFRNYQKSNFLIIISMHLEQMNAETYLQKFSQFKYPQMCRIKIMLEPKTLDKTNDIIEKAKKFGYTDFVIQPLTINGKVHPKYTEEEKNFLKNNSHPVKIQLFNEYKEEEQIIRRDFTKEEFVLNPELVDYSGMQCLAGFSSLVVLADGRINPCFRVKGSQDFNLNTHSLLEYENLYKPVQCPVNQCGCQGFTALPKWNPQFLEAPSYFKEKTIL